MATSDIAKMSVFDPRIIQKAPAFAVNKGALSLTNVPFTAISQTTAQHTYNCPIPSQNVFVDRAIDWTSQLYLDVQMTTTATSVPVGSSYLDLGRDCALTNFPIHSLIQTMTATINDTTVTMNTQDVLKEVLRLTSTCGNKKSRTCPTMDDLSVLYSDLASNIGSMFIKRRRDGPLDHGELLCGERHSRAHGENNGYLFPRDTKSKHRTSANQ
jgi:hypothetical protein